MPKSISPTLQALYSELIERASLARLQTDFLVDGSFYEASIKGASYWYFQASSEGGRAKKYVGKDSPELRKTIAAHKDAKDDFRQRREIVSALLRAGFKGPDALTGKILERLAETGVFRMRAVVVGTVAYQTYSALLGVKLGQTNSITSDLDIAQFPEVSIAVQDQVDHPLHEMLQGIDPSFRTVPHISDGQRVTTYALGGTKYRVDILAPNRGPDTDMPVRLPALKTDAQPLRFLDFLIRDEVRAVALHGAGVLINIPAPERYALHKLIVSRSRHESPDSRFKAQKDLRQAAELIDVLVEQRPYELRDSWREMTARGPKWRQRAFEGASLLPDRIKTALAKRVGVNELAFQDQDGGLDKGSTPAEVKRGSP